MFCDERSNAANICEADVVIIVDGEVKVIIEIDTNDNPARLCGKVDITTYAKLASYGCEVYPMADEISFIQILAPVTNGNSSKMDQRKNIQGMFQKRLAEGSFGRIRHYQILEETGNVIDCTLSAVSR
jgi:hypothetical protein